MKQIVTVGIVLARINYGEADRIVTILTPDHGKIRLLARGVRKIKSRLAGGIELFSINDLTYIKGKGDLHVLISSRLRLNYGNIIKDVNRTMYAYDVLKIVNKITQDSTESEYFFILSNVLEVLHDSQIKLNYVKLWLAMKLLAISGQSINLSLDNTGQRLKLLSTYMFNFDEMAFEVDPEGIFDSRHIKLLRLCEVGDVYKLSRVKDSSLLIDSLLGLLQSLTRQNLNF